MAAALHLRGNAVFPYMDNWLVVSPSPELLDSRLQVLLLLQSNLSLCINLEKSILSSSQILQFTGALCTLLIRGIES